MLLGMVCPGHVYRASIVRSDGPRWNGVQEMMKNKNPDFCGSKIETRANSADRKLIMVLQRRDSDRHPWSRSRVRIRKQSQKSKSTASDKFISTVPQTLSFLPRQDTGKESQT
jgi:hypothetical protein